MAGTRQSSMIALAIGLIAATTQPTFAQAIDAPGGRGTFGTPTGQSPTIGATGGASITINPPVAPPPPGVLPPGPGIPLTNGTEAPATAQEDSKRRIPCPAVGATGGSSMSIATERTTIAPERTGAPPSSTDGSGTAPGTSGAPAPGC